MATKIKIFRENTRNINLHFEDVDLTGATVFFTVKSDFDNDATDSTAIINKDITSHADATNGDTTILLTAANTDVAAGDYKYEIKLKKADGEQVTVAQGEFIIEDSYIRRG